MKPRFSLRALLGTTVLAAALIGWWTEHRKLAGIEDTTIRMLVADSFEFHPSWPVDRVELAGDAVCSVNHDQGTNQISFVSRSPGKAILLLWGKDGSTPSRIGIIVSPAP